MNDLELQKTIQLQRQASDPSNSVWVFASAGSGKTKILTDRVLRLLLEGNHPNKILCLTFTKVAAHEMQNRINEELAKWVLMDEEELKKKLQNLTGETITNSHLRKAQTLLAKVLDCENGIKIQTIHSFCQNILKIFPFEAQIKANFELLEGNQEKILLKNAQLEVLQKAQNDHEIGRLAKNINSKLSEEGFEELLGEILQKKERFFEAISHFFGPENLSEAIFKIFNLKKSQNINEIFDEFLSVFDAEKNRILAEELQKSDSDKNKDLSQKILRFLSNKTLENFEILYSAYFTEKNSIRKIYGQPAKDKSLLDIISTESLVISDFSQKITAHNIAKNSSDLIIFASEIMQKYQELKNAGNFLDYNDLILITNKLLSNQQYSAWIKMKLDGAFDHILVDESQDTNHKQWEIIKALSEDFFSGFGASEAKRSIFIVGDEKQSIYAFQGAEANISSEIYQYFNEKLGANLKKIELNNSFRSLPKILQAVDEVFIEPSLQKAITSESNFTGHKSIRSGEGIVEIWPQIFNPKNQDDEENEAEEFDKIDDENAEEKGGEILAKLIALKIQKLIAHKEANFGDFMILLRNRTNGFAKQIIKEFQKRNINFSSVGSVKFSENILVQDLLSLANFTLLPKDDLNLACLLKSPFFNFSEEDLLEICLRKNQLNCSIFEAFSLCDSSENSHFNKKMLHVFWQLKQMQNCAKELSAFEFFYKVLKQENFQENFIQNFGSQATQIIDRFLNITQNFCQKYSLHLQKFIEFVNSLDPEISMESSDLNSVKITTVHSAKGLQAKIVFLPDCCYNFKQSRSSKSKVSWIELGEEKVAIPIWKSDKSSEITQLNKFNEEFFQSAQNEYLRLLYVAMTRAENALYIGGFGNSRDLNCWYEIIKKQIKSASIISLEELQNELLQNNNLELEVDGNNSQNANNLLDHKASIFNYSQPKNRINNISNFAANRGKVLHKLMEILGKNYRENKTWLKEIANKIIDKSCRDFDLNKDENLEIKTKIDEFLLSEKFEEIFSGEVFCEYEIILSDQKNIGRVDIMTKNGNSIHIIDYKSGNRTFDTLEQYKKQLKNYRESVEKIYPNYSIKTSIFWLEDFELESI